MISNLACALLCTTTWITYKCAPRPGGEYGEHAGGARVRQAATRLGGAVQHHVPPHGEVRSLLHGRCSALHQPTNTFFYADVAATTAAASPKHGASTTEGAAGTALASASTAATTTAAPAGTAQPSATAAALASTAAGKKNLVPFILSIVVDFFVCCTHGRSPRPRRSRCSSGLAR